MIREDSEHSEHSSGAGVGAVGGGALVDSEHSVGAERQRVRRVGGGRRQRRPRLVMAQPPGFENEMLLMLICRLCGLLSGDVV